MRSISQDVEDLRRAWEALNLLGDQASSVFWSALSDITRHVHIIDLNQDILARVANVQSQLSLSPSDALILATVA